MKRNIASFTINDAVVFKQQMLNWANQFNICCFLDSHSYEQRHSSYDCLLAAGAVDVFSPFAGALSQLDAFCKAQADWLFGHINYGLDTGIGIYEPASKDRISFPPIFFFRPLIVVELKGRFAVISSVAQPPNEIFAQITGQTLKAENTAVTGEFIIKPCLQKEEYTAIIKKIQGHILRGDCYELNFCQEFFAENAEINPLQVYKQLVQLSPNPFSCYYKLENKYLLCASPERYVKRTGDSVISQPIKGTAKRNTENAEEDEKLKEGLRSSPKERSENVMVVDLVRNDLSKVCVPGTVETEELFGVYTFPQVHQLISTVKGTLNTGVTLAGILEATFPMGSMTGAPKKRVMELIQQYEKQPRGIFSGSVGYVTPSGDFDFNVVIRSIIYNAKTRYLQYLVGSGITFYSDADQEYAECMLKAQAIEQVLKPKKPFFEGIINEFIHAGALTGCRK